MLYFYFIGIFFILIIIIKKYSYIFSLQNDKTYNNSQYFLWKHILYSVVVVAISSRLEYIIINYNNDLYFLGLYGSALSLAAGFTIISSAIYQVSTKHVLSIQEKSYIKFYIKNNYITFLLCLSVLFLIWLGKEHIIVFVYGHKYKEAGYLFFILSIFYALQITFAKLEGYMQTLYPRYVWKIGLLQIILFSIGAIIALTYKDLIAIVWIWVVTKMSVWVCYLWILSKNQSLSLKD